MPDEPAIVREDVDAILGVLWDIKLLLLRLVRVAEGDDDEEEG